MAQGSLLLGGATSDRISLGAGTGLTDLNVVTYIGLFFPTSLANGSYLVGRTGAVTPYKRWTENGTGGNIAFRVAHATTDANYTTSDTPLVTLNRWYCCAVIWDSTQGAGNRIKIYTGIMGPAYSPMAANAMTASNEPVGAITTESSATTVWGNNGVTSPVSSFKGNIGPCAAFPAALSPADLQSWQQTPRLTVGANVAAAFGRPGKNGADWIEYTANTGTVTGATQADGCPIYQRGYRRTAGGIYVANSLLQRVA